MIFHIGERCAGSGHAGNIHRSVHVALADARAGFRGVLGHVAHAVQAVLAVFRPVDGNEGIEALLGGHLVIAVRTVKDVIEAAVRLPEGQEVFCQRVAVFHKAGIVKADSQLAQGNDDLRDGFYVRCSP